MRELCVCGCGRYAEKGSSFFDENTCGVRYNPNDYPYERDDDDQDEE